MDNPWELYESHPDFVAANTAINLAWKRAKRIRPGSSAYVRARAAEEFMFATLSDWVNVGALDTEPVSILRMRVAKHFGQAGGWL